MFILIYNSILKSNGLLAANGSGIADVTAKGFKSNSTMIINIVHLHCFYNTESRNSGKHLGAYSVLHQLKPLRSRVWLCRLGVNLERVSSNQYHPIQNNS